MPDTIELEIATPERQLVREDVTEVQLPGKSGYMGILPGHAALLGQLGTGFLSYTVSGRKRYLSVQGGFVEVLPDHVRVLANTAERAEEIDVDRAKQDLKTAQEQVINPALGVDPAVALDAMAWAQARVDAAAQKSS
jgi:F-type H+-transporting ATPase subunit epsilon